MSHVERVSDFHVFIFLFLLILLNLFVDLCCFLGYNEILIMFLFIMHGNLLFRYVSVEHFIALTFLDEFLVLRLELAHCLKNSWDYLTLSSKLG